MQLGDFVPTTKRIGDLFAAKTSAIQNIYHSLTFLLKGTPFLMYGDELEFKSGDKQMKWDNTPSCGFSNNASTLESTNCDKNVKRFSATGAGHTLPRIYKSMADLRKNPSFQWGKITFDEKEPLITFARQAEGFESFLVVANLENEAKIVDFEKMLNISTETGKVAYFYSVEESKSHEFKVDSEIKLDNIFLKHGELLVVKFNATK